MAKKTFSFDKKLDQVVLASLVINLVIMAFLGFFDLLTSILYLATGFIILKFVKSQKLGNTQIIGLGIVISLAYNGLGTITGIFIYSLAMIIPAAIQQGLVTLITTKIFGGVTK